MYHLDCDPLHCEFTLSESEGAWRKKFDSFEGAYEYAEGCASSEVPLVLRNFQGAVILETTIFPLEPELLKARAHWRELIASGRSEGPALQTAWLADVAV